MAPPASGDTAIRPVLHATGVLRTTARARWRRGRAVVVELVASISSVVRHARVVVQQKLRAAEAAEGIRRAHTLDQMRSG
jgi:hypothetical protein